MKKMTVTIVDSLTNESQEVEITANQDGISIKPKGYGDYCSENGKGTPVLIEHFEGKLRVAIWSDINQEDYTHLIDLENAREDLREEEA